MKALSPIQKLRQAIFFGFMCIAATPLVSYSQKSNASLFDGKTFKGWKKVGGDAPFTIQDGMIVGEMTKGTPNTFLVTEKQYGDFILELEIKLEGTETNSGIQIRSHIDSTSHASRRWMYGKQVEVDPTPRAWTGGIYDEARRRWLYPLDLNEQAKSAYKTNAFNKVRIEAIGSVTKTWINGIPVAHLIDTIDREGHIALQVHSIPAHLHGAKVYFKNIRFQTENLKPQEFHKAIYVVNLTPNQLSSTEKNQGVELLFNGQDAQSWRSARSMQFPEKGWTIQDGQLRVEKSDGAESTNGGDIISKARYEAFDLSFEFKLTQGANSGVKYFVTLKEETVGSAIGLEYQILDDKNHPDAKAGREGNRTLASLYDLIKANKPERAINPIGQWNRGRIVVTPDNKVTHYLNGEKVLEYVRGSQEFKDLVALSKYKDWDNFGLAESGHILLQDHGDEVTFHSIKIKKLK